MKRKNTLPQPKESADREKSLLDNTPAIFNIERDPRNNKPSLWDEIRTVDKFGRDAVRKYDKEIYKSAEKNNIDPDILRAIMYAENSRGHYLVLNSLGNKFKVSKTILPMNVKKKWVGVIGGNPNDIYDPSMNIEVSAILLLRIRDRIENPTPEKIAFIWNFAGKEKTSIFGEYVGQLYKEKPWKKHE